MIRASLLVGSALAAASLTLAAPAFATPAPTQGLSGATSTAAAAPGSLGNNMPKSVIYVQDAGMKDGARIGDDSADGYYSRSATDGATLDSAFYKPAL